MSEIFENAIASILLGIEDFETGTDERMLSAARNYYAGLLLLAKECLVRAAPNADAMEIIGAKFKPKPDSNGGVYHEVVGYTTIDLAQLKSRFKDFELDWPDADIVKLQRFRNDLEHHHLKEPVSALGEAIASSFPMVVDFCTILGEDPQSQLADGWDTILAQRTAYEKVQKQCIASLERVDWPAQVSDLDRMACPECGSSLLGQDDPDNEDRESVVGKCYQCGAEIGFEKMMELVVAASYEIDAYIMAKEGMSSPIADCPECSAPAYVESGYTSICFICGESIAGDCARCGADIDVNEYNSEYPDLCSYCAYMSEKVMRE